MIDSKVPGTPDLRLASLVFAELIFIGVTPSPLVSPVRFPLASLEVWKSLPTSLVMRLIAAGGNAVEKQRTVREQCKPPPPHPSTSIWGGYSDTCMICLLAKLSSHKQQ